MIGAERFFISGVHGFCFFCCYLFDGFECGWVTDICDVSMCSVNSWCRESCEFMLNL